MSSYAPSLAGQQLILGLTFTSEYTVKELKYCVLISFNREIIKQLDSLFFKENRSNLHYPHLWYCIDSLPNCFLLRNLFWRTFLTQHNIGQLDILGLSMDHRNITRRWEQLNYTKLNVCYSMIFDTYVIHRSLKMSFSPSHNLNLSQNNLIVAWAKILCRQNSTVHERRLTYSFKF